MRSDFLTVKQYKPDKNGLVTIKILTAVMTVVLITAVRLYLPVPSLNIIISSAILAVAVFAIFIYLPLYFKSLRYESSDEEITRVSGVFIKRHQSVRYDTVQYTTVVSMPFSQYTGLNFLIFFVYGGQLTLLFLSQSDAVEILHRTGNSDMPEVRNVP